VIREITERGPLSFKDLTDPARRERPKTEYAESSVLWWPKRPSDGKHVLEGLWREGRLAVSGRRRGFERVFDLAERVVPAEILSAPPLGGDDAQRTLVLHAAKALGIGWLKDFADFFRLPVAATKARLRELVDAGTLEAATVEGSKAQAYVHPTASAGAVTARALLSPFDSLLWERSRNVRLFDFHHSFEIYMPETKRRFGYYVLPFLVDEALVGRVDLKADRAQATLLVQGAYSEPDVSANRVASELAGELRRVAAWLELERIDVRDRGELASPLRRAVRKPAP